MTTSNPKLGIPPCDILENGAHTVDNARDAGVSADSVGLGDRQRWEALEGAVATIVRMLRDTERGRFGRPLLTIREAAEMLSLSTKRFEDIIGVERGRLGRTPDFVVDADGRISRRVLRDELLEWARGHRRTQSRRVTSRSRRV